MRQHSHKTDEHLAFRLCLRAPTEPLSLTLSSMGGKREKDRGSCKDAQTSTETGTWPRLSTCLAESGSIEMMASTISGPSSRLRGNHSVISQQHMLALARALYSLMLSFARKSLPNAMHGGM
jgi:hypothetical protein